MNFAEQNRISMGSTGRRSPGRVNPPGMISPTDRQRMLSSLTPDQQDVYIALDADRVAQGQYEDAWLAQHPASAANSQALSYRFAEDTLGLANGAFLAILTSADHAAQANLEAQTAQKVREF